MVDADALIYLLVAAGLMGLVFLIQGCIESHQRNKFHDRHQRHVDWVAEQGRIRDRGPFEQW